MGSLTPGLGLEPRLIVIGGGFLIAASILGALSGMDPKLGIVAAAGIAFVVLVLSNLAAGVYIFAVAAFLDVLPFGGAAVTFAKAIGLLLAVSWFAVIVTHKESVNDFMSDRPAFSLVLIALVVWALLSLTWAEDSSASVASAYRYALNIALFVIVYAAIRTRKNAIWLVAAFLLGAVISAAYGIVAPGSTNVYDVDRLGGAGVDANELAALLVSALALATAFAVAWRNAPFVRIAAIMVMGICTAGVFLSLSRGGLVALAVSLVAAVLFAGRWRLSAVAFLLCISLGTVGYFSTIATPEQRERVVELEGGTGRSDIWTVGWRMVEAEPLRGVGAGNFPIASIHFLLEPGAILRDEFIVDDPKVAHNIYLEVLAELGVVGLALFLSIIGFSLLSALAAGREFARAGDARMELLSRALAVALVALLAADFFASDQFSKQLWLLLALGPALRRIASREVETPDGAFPDAEQASSRRLVPLYG